MSITVPYWHHRPPWFQEAEKWAQSLVDNLARRPQGNDRAQAKAIFAGECDVAIMNHYYFAKMENTEKEPEQKEWASALRLVMPNQEDRGSHVNISGGGWHVMRLIKRMPLNYWNFSYQMKHRRFMQR